MFHKTNYIRNIRNASSLKKDFYDTLEIAKKATQAEVKSAYYKQSMIYHPDRNKGSEDARNRFRDIAEAYEVLGNVTSRKLYDKGMIYDSNRSRVYEQEEEEEDSSTKFHKARMRRKDVPVTGRTPIYDFDTWTRAHYSDTREKTFKRKEQSKNREEKKEVKQSDHGFFTILCGAILLLVAFASLEKTNYDDVSIEKSIIKDKPPDK